ncbi:sugar phosphate nucleotidyltransferase [Pelagibacterium limicola]|uniref:sugar phosphate nucleotidyltransferase n=1 Tax=Pelagibacterium limicola TaxID=2791022 RepID=UPI0018AF8CA1
MKQTRISCVAGQGSVATILLAGGQGTRLCELTARQAKPALYFAGTHRIIDFVMANVVRSGLDRLVVATQFAPGTLEAHVPLRWGHHFQLGQCILQNGKGAYRGTADAVRNNLSLVSDPVVDTIVVLAADHVYEMDYAAMIEAHRASGAAVTVGVDVVPQSDASGFGVMHADEQGVVTSFQEKPACPPAIIGEPGYSMVSMGIYVFSRVWLEEVLLKEERALDFGHHVIPLAVDQRVATTYRLPASEGMGRPYWRDVGTLDAFRLTQIEFAHKAPCRLPGEPSATSWFLGRGTIAMPGALVSPGARLSRTIVAPGVHIPSGLVTGEDTDEDRRWFRCTEGGTVLINQTMVERWMEHRASVRPRSTASRPAGRFNLGVLLPALDDSRA